MDEEMLDDDPNVASITAILNAGESLQGWTPAQDSTWHGGAVGYALTMLMDEDFAADILRRGVGIREEVARPDKHGCTVLHNTIENNLDCEALIPLLVKCGAPLDAQDNDREVFMGLYQCGGCTPLHVAARKGAVEAVEALLAAGADPAAVDNAGRVPYAHAYLYTNNSARQARVLDLLAPVTPESKRVTAAQARALNKTALAGAQHRVTAQRDVVKHAFAARLAKPATVVGARVVFIPASGCNHPWRQNWYRRVATTIMDTLGVEVVFPLDGMPDPTGCREKVWMPYIKDTLRVDERTVVIGHSAGADAALRLAEGEKLLGVVLASPGAVPDSDSDNNDEAALEEYGWHDRPWQWRRARSNVGFVLQYHGADDSIVPVEVGRRVRDALGDVVYREFPAGEERGHFMDPDFPELAADVIARLRDYIKPVEAATESQATPGSPGHNAVVVHAAAGAGAGAAGAGARTDACCTAETDRVA